VEAFLGFRAIFLSLIFGIGLIGADGQAAQNMTTTLERLGQGATK
jgi:hypothetical protein